jgi:hypothetical protein
MASDPEVGPLDPALAEVIEEERPLRSAPAGSRARVLERLDTSLGGGLTGTPPAAPPSSQGPGGRGAAGWLARGAAVATFVVGIAVGAAWSPRGRVVVDAPSSSAPARESQPAPFASAVEAITPSTTASSVQIATVDAGASVSPAPPSAPRPAPERDDLAQERSLLEAARTALLRRDASGTLAMLQKHATRYPNGRLAEERDALIVQALALAGRGDEARARTEAFEKRYPQSLFLPSVRGASSTGGAPR